MRFPAQKLEDSTDTDCALQKLEGRRKPSGSKLNFLLHLDDYRQQSCLGLRDASLSLEQVSNYVELEPQTVDPKLQGWYDELSKDIHHLQEHLKEIGNILTELRTTVRCDSSPCGPYVIGVGLSSWRR